MVQSSTQFQDKRFVCKCGCGKASIDFYLVNLLNKLEEYFNYPPIIYLGVSCEDHNKVLGSSQAHIYGKAVDFAIPGVHIRDVEVILNSFTDICEISRYRTYIHMEMALEKTN